MANRNKKLKLENPGEYTKKTRDSDYAMSLDQIAHEFGLTRMRISQIVNEQLRILRDTAQETGLSEFDD